MSSSTESRVFLNIAATPGAFTLMGGRYAVILHAGAWNAGSVALKALAADLATWVACDNAAMGNTPFAADGIQQFDLPPGQYQLAIALATGVYATVARIPI